MTVYKADLKTNFYYIIGLVILFGVAVPLSANFSSDGWFSLPGFLFLFFLYNLFTLRLHEIQVDKSSNLLTTIYKDYFRVRKTKKYDLTNIRFTYKRQATSFRGGIKNVCLVYHSGKKIFQIVPDDDGWEDGEIYSFLHGLIDAGVKKQFTGYGLKDAEI